MSVRKLIVIGGGPSGIMAAGRAAELGVRTILLEKGPRLARKLRITGKGRCNITNTADLPEFIEAFEPNGKFLYGAFSRFFRDDLLELLKEQGLHTKVERGGRIFPESDKAGDVADALERWLYSHKVDVRFNTRAKSIDVQNGKVSGVNIFGGRMDADAVIIAAGGASYPKTGSTGDGYSMARNVGHTIIAPRPALSALITEEAWVKELQGLTLKNVEASLFVNYDNGNPPRKIASEFGEMLFTHFGVSGPIILTLSRGVGELLRQGKVYISINLKPALTPEQLHARLIRDFKHKKLFKNYLKELLPRLLAEIFYEFVDIDPNKPVNSITAVERTRIVDRLKDFQVSIKSMGSLEEAIVTAGGVSLKEVDPRTMMSKIVSGLFFAGEVLDIDGKTGGYNLQASFSTGYVAGESAAQFILSSC